MESQLIEGHLTVRELGSVYGLKSYQMLHVLKTLGISIRNNTNDTRIFDSSIDSSLHQVLIGTLMGDAFMKYPKCYQLGHGLHQLDYIYHVAERLKCFIAYIGDKDNDCVTKKSFCLRTFRHSVFIPYFDRFYSFGPKKKYFIENTAQDLEAEGLAYWFMDDGKYNEYGFYLCVGNITDKEGEILRHLLKNKFNLETNFQIHDKEKNYHNIYIKAESRHKFLSLIEPFIIPSMRYKVDGFLFPKIEFNKEHILKNHLDLCKKAGRFIRYSGEPEIVKGLSSYSRSDSKSFFINKILKNILDNSQISKTSIRKLPDMEELSKLLSDGLTDGRIAQRYGVGRNRIAKLRVSLGIQDLRSRLTIDQENKLKILLFKQETNVQRIMDEVGISYYRAKRYIS
jgi:hypothetical protein